MFTLLCLRIVPMCSYYKSPLTQYNMPVRSILAGQAPCAGQMLLSLRPHSSSDHKSTFQHPKETATAVTNYIQNTLERRSCSLVLLLCRLRSYYHNMALYRNHRKKIIPKYPSTYWPLDQVPLQSMWTKFRSLYSFMVIDVRSVQP